MVIDQSQADTIISLLAECNVALKSMLALALVWSAVVLIKKVLFDVLSAYFD